MAFGKRGRKRKQDRENAANQGAGAAQKDASAGKGTTDKQQDKPAKPKGPEEGLTYIVELFPGSAQSALAYEAPEEELARGTVDSLIKYGLTKGHDKDDQAVARKVIGVMQKERYGITSNGQSLNPGTKDLRKRFSPTERGTGEEKARFNYLALRITTQQDVGAVLEERVDKSYVK